MIRHTSTHISETPILKERMLYLETSSGNLPVFAVQPEVYQHKVAQDTGPYPGVIVIHEIFGLNEHIKNVSRRYAEQFMCVWAPDLFSHYPNCPQDTNDLALMRELWQSIPDEELIANLKLVFALAQTNGQVMPTKIGTVGYCMGGAIAFMFACQTPEMAWVANYYGRIMYPELSKTKAKHPLDYAAGLNCPVLALFAGKDDLIPPVHLGMLASRLAALNKAYTLKVYPDAQHAFFNDERPAYHGKAAADAWQITLDFIGSTTRPSA